MPTIHIDLDPFVDRMRQTSDDTAVFLTFSERDIVERIDLDPADPVTSLFGRRVGEEILAVGLHAPATVTPVRAPSRAPSDQMVIHVTHRSGTAITVLHDRRSTRRFGPSDEPQRGRVPDACRRMFGLPTAPPTESMTAFVAGAWLEVVARRAVDRPDLPWSDVVALHPAWSSIATPATPAAVADATRTLGTALDWERFRRVIATVGGFPFGPDAAELAAWMDAGFFSRWALDCLPAPNDLLDMLGAVLGPACYDRLWATIRLCD